ncbi:uncharacterized protein LOC118229036 isoform X2 [Anguilla anguilla]|uniref:uncharacterized protein LOC118229036 isoform X2 n=1 Tax=Anguilla anguilla TaxID=7936 RepID=UPI0015ADFEB2|nr:uncharacterized protein LOC118229036 isoform X2 [Anguilla anguilla]
MKKTAAAMKKSKDAKVFFEDNLSHLIDTLSKADIMKMADLLLQNKCISDATYETIHKEHLEQDRMRSLHRAMKPGDLQSYLVCYEYLEKCQPCIIQNLERKTGDETASEPLRKKARIEEPDQTQVQDATNETDSGSTPNFTGWTLSKLLEHVEDPVNMKHLVTSLEQRLEDGEMEQLECKLQNRALKNAVSLNHKAFRDICINKELTTFLASKSQAKFPKLAIEQFFTGGSKGRPKPLRTQDEPEKDNGDSGTMQNWQSAEPSRMQEESFDQNSPGVQNMTGMDTELSVPIPQSTLCHSKMETNSIRMQKSLSVSSDKGYDTQKSSLSILDPPQEAQREFKTSMTTPSECQQSISGEAVAEDGATTSEATSAATPAAIASAATAKLAAIASPATAKSADTASSPTADTDTASSVAVAANGDLTKNGNSRKQQNRKVYKKTTEEMLRKNRKDILLKFFEKIPPTSGTVRKMEELEKIRIVDCREHPSCPLLLADHCIVFHEANQKQLIEILDSAAFRKDSELKEEFRFKVQFHMWLLDIAKTVVLSKEEDSREIQANSFKEKKRRFQQYLHKVVIPLFAVYKKVQREREL